MMPGVRDSFQCSFLACRVGFRRCWQFILCHKPLMFVLKDHYNILCLGLSGAGKSTLLANLVDEVTTQIEPTKGFNIKTLPIRDTIVCIKEVGGSPEIRPFWDCYFNNTSALLYIVKASSSESELANSRDTLRTLLSNGKLRNKPCLIVGTHTDQPDARTDEELEQFFQGVMHGHKWRVHNCLLDKQAIINVLESLIELMTISKK